MKNTCMCWNGPRDFVVLRQSAGRDTFLLWSRTEHKVNLLLHVETWIVEKLSIISTPTLDLKKTE